MDNRERARARDKKQTRRLENARDRQGEASKVKMGGNEKKKRTGTQATKSLVSSYDIFFHKNGQNV